MFKKKSFLIVLISILFTSSCDVVFDSIVYLENSSAEPVSIVLSWGDHAYEKRIIRPQSIARYVVNAKRDGVGKVTISNAESQVNYGIGYITPDQAIFTRITVISITEVHVLQKSRWSFFKKGIKYTASKA